MAPPVPFNDLSRRPPDLLRALTESVARVVDSGWYLLGPETEAFEEEFAAYCGASGCVGVANGTDALELALRAIGCRPGDEVILTANAGNYATTACRAIGATPVYADVDDTTLLLDPAAAARLVSPSTRGIVATHLYGNVVDIDAVRGALPGVAVVEDCAQAHGASLRGDRVGSLGDIAAFSFYPTKNLGGLGDAGAVVTSSADHLLRARQLRQYGWTERYRVGVEGGRNSRIDEIQAAVLRTLLPTLDAANDRRRAIQARYRDELSGRLELVQDAPGEVTTVAHLVVARSPRRDAVVRELAERGVQAAVHYPIADHRQPTASPGSYRADSLVVTDQACAEVLSLPCFPELGDDEVGMAIDAVRSLT
jgi:dTDP-4-amino-4,6-dideoxygalactose transaminase